MKYFKQVLLNTLIANVTASYLWFALTFWDYLETRSVMVTAIIGGIRTPPFSVACTALAELSLPA